MTARRPWSRAGRIVLIEDISRSDRSRLPPVRPDGGMIIAALVVVSLAIWLVAAIAAIAWWLA